ncbi:MAG: hypothetical protein IKH20_11775 [Clostridiales bacterium]|nr:hypothetical protein [Clostridiales bacterium]
MKDKVLKSEVMKAAENLARALRNYTNETMYLKLVIITREPNFRDDSDPDDSVPDAYHAEVSGYYPEDIEDKTLVVKNKLFYTWDEYGDESIRFVVPIDPGPEPEDMNDE